MSVSVMLHGVSFVGIYSLYGLLQEKIVKTSYGPQADKFESYSLLILASRALVIVVGIIVVSWQNRGRSASLLRTIRPSSPLLHYGAVGAFTFVACTCQLQALDRVSFTTATLAKGTSIVPVIVVQQFIYRYPAKAREWIGYLIFDGLASTFQEQYFPRRLSSSTTDPSSSDFPVLPRIVLVSAFICLFSLGGLLIDARNGTFLPSISLLLRNERLQLDVLWLSTTSAIGLFLLVSTTSSFGAPTISAIMALRQFTGVGVNAAVFNHFGTIALEGWCGVGLVASGMFIGLNGSWDEDDMATSRYPTIADPEEEELLKEGRHSHSISIQIIGSSSVGSARSGSLARLARGYTLQLGLPLLLPFLLYSLAFILNLNSTNVNVNLEPDLPSVRLEGGEWDRAFYRAIRPNCTAASNTTTPVRWEGGRRTALVSHPRSGNTLTREGVERVLGLQTSSVYCDRSLEHTFVGECDHTAKLLVKTHFPMHTPDEERYPNYVPDHHFEQAVHLIRNPLDAIYSDWQLFHVPKTEDGQLDHSARLNISRLGSTTDQRNDILRRASIWAMHLAYWSKVEIAVLQVRHEDMMHNRLSTLMSIIAFLLPQEELPSLDDLVCVVEVDEAREAYRSRKAPEFSSWDLYTPELRVEVIKMLRSGWCRHGYDQLLRARMGRETGVDDVCSRRTQGR